MHISRIEQNGFGSRTIRRNYEGVDNGTPLLNRFYFLYSGHFVDHHINQVMIQPDGLITDLAPSADPPSTGVNPNDGQITLSFQDQGGADEYYFSVGHTMVTGLTRFRMRDVGCTGECIRPLPTPPIQGSFFALIGFQIAFTGGRDHHLDEFGVFEEEGDLHVLLNDKNDDDVFLYAVDFAWIPPSRIVGSGNRSGVAEGAISVPFHPLGSSVLSGFHLDFRRKDHEIRDMGVLLKNSNIEIYYGDSNFDDTFDWRVKWVTLWPFPGIAIDTRRMQQLMA